MARDNRVSAKAILKVQNSMNGIYNLGLEKFLSSLGMRGFVGVWRPLTCGNRPVSNRNLYVNGLRDRSPYYSVENLQNSS